MISFDVERVIKKNSPSNYSSYYVEGKCLSTDVKPTSGLANGSILIEMDTSKVFIFDEPNSLWREFK